MHRPRGRGGYGSHHSGKRPGGRGHGRGRGRGRGRGGRRYFSSPMDQGRGGHGGYTEQGGGHWDDTGPQLERTVSASSFSNSDGGGGRHGRGRGRGRGRGGYPWWEHLPGGSRHKHISEEEKERRKERKRMELLYENEPEQLILPPEAAEALQRGVDEMRAEFGALELMTKHVRDRNAQSTDCKEAWLDRGMTSCQLTNVQLATRHADKRLEQQYCEMREQRLRLPVFENRETLLAAVAQHQVVVISGQTGCGKTTQVPQFILDAAIESGHGSEVGIVCTQPRRICAISVAERVASERAEIVGDSVGYQIRLERKAGDNTQLLFCTSGILLRRLQVDPHLIGCTHIILDEVHERTLDSDFLLIILRDLLPQRPEVKLILMSATLNAESFSEYFGSCPMIHIPGITFPVEQYFLEDALEVTGHSFHNKEVKDLGKPQWGNPVYRKKRKQLQQKMRDHNEGLDWRFEEELLQKGFSQSTIESLRNFDDTEIPFDLIQELVLYIHRCEGDGAILVFLPGWGDISKLHKSLKECYESASLELFALHSQMPSSEQRSIFLRPPPGRRKVIISTNIAESSITIDDVVFVIDSGKHKEKSYDPEAKLASLLPTWVSQASATQRKGRAGRVQSGKCWHLFSRHQYQLLDEYQQPEILREPLESLCLRVRGLKVARTGQGGVMNFLGKALSPPSEVAVANAIEKLIQIGGMNIYEELTALGHHLLLLPVEPQIGKALVYSCLFGCLEPMLTIASLLSLKSPFLMSLNNKSAADQAKARFAEDQPSDHYALLRAYEGWERARKENRERDFCFRNFLSSHTLRMVSDTRKQFKDLLCDAGLTKKGKLGGLFNRHCGDWAVIKAVICAGLYPNLIRVDFGRKRPTFCAKDYHKPKLHPSSVNAKNPGIIVHRWLVYHEIVKNIGGIFVYDSSEISALPLLLLGAGNKEGEAKSFLAIETQPDDVVGIEDWVYFAADPDIVPLLEDCRTILEFVLYRRVGRSFDSISRTETDFLDAVAGALIHEDAASDLYIKPAKKPRHGR